MRRREFIISLVGAAVSWPSAASAQRAPIPAVGVLVAGSPGSRATALAIAAFRRGLDEAGFVEGVGTWHSNIALRRVTRSNASPCGRPGSPSGSCYFFEQLPCGARCEGRVRDDTNRVLGWR